jgi:hypothetical protein
LTAPGDDRRRGLGDQVSANEAEFIYILD